MKPHWVERTKLGWVLCVGWLTSSSPAHAFEVLLSGAVERSSTLSRIEVLATVVLPLDEWLQVTPELGRSVSAQPSLAGAWDAAEAAQDSDSANDGAELQWLIDPPWPSAAPIAQAQADDSRSELEPRKAGPPPKSTVHREPRVTAPTLDRQFIQALMAACSTEFKSVRADLENLADRARLSAWLPELQVKGGRNTDQTLRLTPTEAEPDRYQVVGGDGVRFEGQMRWTFSQLVFARDELAVARLRAALDVEKRKRQQQAMEALSKWFAAWMLLGSTPEDDAALLEAWIDESALRAELDWLSQGWFSAHVPAAPEWAELHGR